MCMFNCTGCYSLILKRFSHFFCTFHGLNSNESILMLKYLSQMLRICMNVNLWERFCFQNECKYIYKKKQLYKICFFVIPIFKHLWLLKKNCRIFCGELLIWCPQWHCLCKNAKKSSAQTWERKSLSSHFFLVHLMA